MLQRTTLPATDRARLSAGWIALLGALALVAVGVPLWIVLSVPRAVPTAHRSDAPVVSKAEVPQVDPVRLVDLAPQDARAFNATVPFSTAPNPAARPFHIFGAEADQARAVDCLAAAVYYEAGDDAVGEEAVAQVVLNRVRHPAFPKSVCGVVFQGAERRTGCQFTFTCDGALARIPSEAAWERARFIAHAALNGRVEGQVGHATHYHTDWVVPYWSASLDKITEVHTHLFFRWTGWWGTPPAFNRRYTGAEQVVAQLATLSSAHGGALPVDVATEAGALEAGAEPSTAVTPPDENTFLVTLDRRANPDGFAAQAIRTCGERAFCKFMGWTDARRMPKGLPLGDGAIDAMSFSYLRNQAIGYGKALWNCDEFKRPSPVQCMRRGGPARVPMVVTLPPQPALPTTERPKREMHMEPVKPPPVVPTR